MNIRKYEDSDFELIKSWSTDPRIHALWCAGRTEYPVNKTSFDSLLTDIAERMGDTPFVATDDEGVPVGFFCYSLNNENKEGMLKFVIVDPGRRGQGLGKKMIAAAVEYAFENTAAEAVHLMVFTVNDRAKNCYESVGFKERATYPDAFKYEDESWGRCNMIIRKNGKDQ